MLSQIKCFIAMHYKIILSSLIFLQVILLVFTFSTKREGFHSDENWSYGYANSFFQPNIYKDDNEKKINIDEWKDSSILRNYIEVNKGQQFRFDSVFSNMSEDFSPPLHSLILHGICSFFPDTFSWWYGFSINIISFIVSIWLLFFIVKNLFSSIYLSYAICLFYGFSSAAINCFIYIRTYGLLTCLSLTFIYLLIILQKSISTGKYLFLIYLTTTLGFLSHYYYYAFAFSLSLIFCINLVAQKKFKILLTFASTMICAVISSLIIFPSAIHMVLKGSTLYAKHMPLSWEIKYCLNIFFFENFGFTPSYPTPVTWCILKFACIFFLIFLGGFLFLFRKEKWLTNFLTVLKIRLKRLFIYFPQKVLNVLRSFWLTLIFTFCFTLALVAKISNVYLMSIYTDRYLFFLMPIFDLCIIKILYMFLQWVTKHFSKFLRPVITIILTLCLILTHVNGYNHYYFLRHSTAPTLTSLTKNANVIVTLKSDWHYVCYTTLLRDSKKIFVCIPNSDCGLDYMKSALEKLDNNLPVYLIMEEASLSGEKKSSTSFDINDFNTASRKIFTSGYTENDIVNFFSSCTWCTSITKLQIENSFQGQLVVYQLR